MVRSGDKTGFVAPVKVREERLGAAGKRKAAIFVTSSFLIVICFFHGRYPSFFSSISYDSGGREMVAFVADSSFPLMIICAPSGTDVTTNKPRGFKVKVFESNR